MTISPFLSIDPIALLASLRGIKSGSLFLFIGVGTVMIKILHSFKSSRLFEKLKLIASFNSSVVVSRVLSTPFFNSFILDSFISNPMTLRTRPNSTARGKPTYPKPTTAIGISLCCIIFPH